MAENEKNMTTGNENDIKKEQQGTPDSPAENKEEKDGFFKKVGNGIKKNGKKIAGVGLGLAVLAVGTVIGDKFGLPFGKKSDDGTEDPAEQ